MKNNNVMTGAIVPLLFGIILLFTGGGLRFLMDKPILRVDAAFSSEGLTTQMYVDHAF